MNVLLDPMTIDAVKGGPGGGLETGGGDGGVGADGVPALQPIAATIASTATIDPRTALTVTSVGPAFPLGSAMRPTLFRRTCGKY